MIEQNQPGGIDRERARQLDGLMPGQMAQVSKAELDAIHQKRVAMAMSEGKQPAHDPWVHRSSGMKCRTCMWFVGKEPQALTVTVKSHEVGRCRRHAPTMGGYPVVYMTDWCGDHRLDENKI